MAPNKEARERLERQYRSPSARMGSPQLEDVPQARSIPAKSAVAPQGRPVTSRVPMPPSTAGAPSVLSASASALGASSAPRLATSRSRARSSRTRAWGREDKRSPEAPDIGRARAHANRTRRERGADKSSDGLRMFLREIGRHTLLTAEEERELSRAVQAQIEASEKRRALSEELGREPSPAEVAAALAISEEELKEREQLGTESRQRMVQCNLRLVVSIAKKYRDRGLEMNDLVAEGIIGLTRAVDKFDPSRGFKFSTYAHWWIRQGVTRAISEQARVVRLPVHLYEIMSKIRKAERDIVVRTGRDPSHEDLAEAVGISVKKIELLFKAYRPTLSMDQPIKSADSESSSLMELVEDTHQQSPEETSVQSQLSGHLEDLLNTLNDRERRILRLRYGLDDGREHTLEDIGRIFNVSVRERVPVLWSFRLACERLPGAPALPLLPRAILSSPRRPAAWGGPRGRQQA